MRKPSKARFDRAGLTSLGIDRLVEILLDEAAFNKALKARLLAALAGTVGGTEVAQLIDKQMDALQKSNSYLSIARANDLANELRGLLRNITTELAAADRYEAFVRLLRFITIGAQIDERASDGGAKLRKVLEEADASVVEAALKLDPAQQLRSVPLLETTRLADTFGRFSAIFQGVLCGFEKPAADAWKARLLDKLKVPAPKRMSWARNDPLAYLQRLASHTGDIDAFIVLEQGKPEDRRDTLKVAEMLHEAKRHAEALEWVRRPSGTFRPLDLGRGGVAQAAPHRQPRPLLEADILDALKRKSEAQTLRWREFEDAPA